MLEEGFPVTRHSRPPVTNLQRVLNALQKATLMVAVVVFNYLGETSDYGSFVKETWQAAKSASPFAAMLCLLLFLDERSERREAQRECADRTQEFVDTLSFITRAFHRIADALKHSKRR